MVQSMLDMYDENGWLPKWELNSTETFTMVGDPASIVITDTYLKGIQDFDVEKAYEAMLKSADRVENNPLRPGLKDYIEKGYLTTDNVGSVSTTLEYAAADNAIALLAKSLGKKDDYTRFENRSLSYKKLFDKNLNLLRPRLKNGNWYEPFDPNAGANFTENIGFIEGNAWQYAFMIPHDINGLKKLMGGDKGFTNQLQKIFDTNQFDMANEPDIAYPYLFNYVKGEEWRSQNLVEALVKKHFKNTPDGIPGNDDTGTMSAWVVYAMMGLYPIAPGEPIYTITKPLFDKITIQLDSKYYKEKELVIEKTGNGTINNIFLNGKAQKGYFINHEVLVTGKSLKIILK
jgi:predicted alpha-1,2-mannosidase